MILPRNASKLLGLSTPLIVFCLCLPGDANNPNSLNELKTRVEQFVEPTLGDQKLFDVHMNIDELDRLDVMSGSAADSVWSGDYWPMRYGAISAEAREDGGYKRGLLGVLSWKVMKKRFDRKWRRLDPRQVPDHRLLELSPAEKLDLLVSDYDLTLSRSVWQSIADHSDTTKRVHMWEGFCHGWASAAIQAPRPVRLVKVRSRDGRYLIPFTPDDLKGLATYLWGESLIQDFTRVAGRRCFKKKSNPDPYTGLSDDPNCNGVDPALFHLALTHLMGIRKETFIINRTADAAIWNQPLHSYQMKYFNLKTGTSGSLAESIIPVEKFGADFERSERDPETRYLVGVDLSLKYVKETKPDQFYSNSAAGDDIRNLDYLYDLELDANRNIIGGRWRDRKVGARPIKEKFFGRKDFDGFPGFIWKVQRSEKIALSVASDAPMWNIEQAIPHDYLDRHRQAAAFRYKIWKIDSQGNILTTPDGLNRVEREALRPQPLSLLVHGLLRAAKGPDDKRSLLLSP